MANITMHIDDDKLLDYLKTNRGLELGHSYGDLQLTVSAEPPTMNSVTSHTVTVSVTYGLDLGAVNGLVGI